MSDYIIQILINNEWVVFDTEQYNEVDAGIVLQEYEEENPTYIFRMKEVDYDLPDNWEPDWNRPTQSELLDRQFELQKIK